MKSFLLIACLYTLVIQLTAQTKLIAYEYWFDNNYQGKVSVPIVSNVNVDLLTDLNISSLSQGIHLVNLRFKDNNSLWTTTQRQIFFKSGGALTGYEYWFDNNYASKKSFTISSQENYSLTQSLSVEGLSTGYHSITVRFKDVGNSWTIPKASDFIKLASGGINTIKSYRYWLDAADTVLVNLQIPTSNTYIVIDDSLNVKNLSTGMHQMHYQFKDTGLVWSPVYSSIFRKIGISRLDNITPNSGGNSGLVTLRIFGEGFYDGTGVKLIKGTDTLNIADSMYSIQSGNIILATFNLTQAKLGFYDVLVKPGQVDTTLIIKNGFKVEQVKPATISMDITGPQALRLNQSGSYSVSVTNTGNINATGIPVWLAFPNTVEPKFEFSTDQITDTSSTGDSIKSFFTVKTLWNKYQGYNVYPIIIPSLAGSKTTYLDFTLKNTSPEKFNAVIWTTPQLYSTSTDPLAYSNGKPIMSFDGLNCILDAVGTVANLFPVVGCVYGLADGIFRPEYNCETYGKDCERKLEYVADLGSAIAGCVPGEKLAFKAARDAFSETLENLDAMEALSNCKKALMPLAAPQEFSVEVLASIDPNEKYGPSSLDSIHKYVSNSGPLNYSIQFENDSAATVAAQTVTILDTLDKKVFDLATFRLGSVRIADTVVNFKSNTKADSVDINLSAFGIYYVCRVRAKLIDSSGVARWDFQTLNSYTLKPANGVFDGFLIPNKKSPQGTGAVSYTISVNNATLLSSKIANKAYIYFDYNPGIPTQTWQNTLDNNKPISNVKPLPSITMDSIVTLKWSGTDIGSGILNYDIYYSVNGSPHIALIRNLRDTTLKFIGKRDSIYSFYSVAKDSALNTENAPSVPDTKTKIKIITISETHANLLCNGAKTGSITISITGARIPLRYQWSNGAITKDLINVASGTYSLTVTDADSSKKTKTVTLTQPSVITIQKTQSNESKTGAKDGKASVTTSGGIQPYKYLWSNGKTTSSISGLTAGTYTVNVTDANACTKNVSFIITTGITSKVIANEKNGVSQGIANDLSVTITPNPGSGAFLAQITNLNQNGVLIIIDGLGKQLVTKNVKKGYNNKTNVELNLFNFPPGVYSLIIIEGTRQMSRHFIINKIK